MVAYALNVVGGIDFSEEPSNYSKAFNYMTILASGWLQYVWRDGVTSVEPHREISEIT